MPNPTIMRPKLNRLIKAVDERTARVRAHAAKENVSSFFSHLYQTIYGGRLLIDSLGKDHNPKKEYSFSPDIERQELERQIYTEIKATSTKSCKISSSSTQEGNNLAEIVRRTEGGEHPIPFVEYGLIKYGPWKMHNLHKLDNSELVKSLAASEKTLLILPLNVLLFLASFAREETRDQENSCYSADTQDYHVIRGSVLTSLLNNGGPLLDLVTDHTTSVLEKLCLRDVEVEHGMTPNVKGFYRAPFSVEAFPVTKYFVPEEKYEKLVRNLVKHRQKLTMAIGIPDVVKKIREKKKREMEEKRRKLEEELKKVPF